MTPTSRSFHVASILGAGMLVYVVKNLVHEAVGHGGACLLVGCVPEALTSAWFSGRQEHLSQWAQRGIDAGGTVANLGFALALIPLWRAISRKGTSGVLAYCVWLSIVTNLLSGGGYMMVDPIGNFGDWSAFLAGLQPQLPIRLAVIVTGVAVSLAGLNFGARTIHVFLGGHERRRRGRWLCLGPYVIAGVAFPLAAAFNPGGPQFILTSALATLGGTAWLIWLAFLVRPAAPPSAGPAIALPRTSWAMIAGLLAAAFTIGVLGPGIRF